MADLLVSIPSRDRPQQLLRTIAMLYSTCANRRNFDLQLITDFDQEEMYRELRVEFPQFKWSGVEYCGGHWLNLINKQHDYFLGSNYYFMWYLVDDLHGLENDWDIAILDKKKAFEDDLFVLYTDGAKRWGRTRDAHESCYIDNIDNHDPNPIWTRKWCEFIAPLFKSPSPYVVYRELIIAAILRLLYLEGINRNIHCNVKYAGPVNDMNSVKFAQAWYDLQKRDYDDLKPIVKAMKEYIDGY